MNARSAGGPECRVVSGVRADAVHGLFLPLAAPLAASEAASKAAGWRRVRFCIPADSQHGHGQGPEGPKPVVVYACQRRASSEKRGAWSMERGAESRRTTGLISWSTSKTGIVHDRFSAPCSILPGRGGLQRGAASEGRGTIGALVLSKGLVQRPATTNRQLYPGRCSAARRPPALPIRPSCLICIAYASYAYSPLVSGYHSNGLYVRCSRLVAKDPLASRPIEGVRLIERTLMGQRSLVTLPKLGNLYRYGAGQGVSMFLLARLLRPGPRYAAISPRHHAGDRGPFSKAGSGELGAGTLAACSQPSPASLLPAPRSLLLYSRLWRGWPANHAGSSFAPCALVMRPGQARRPSTAEFFSGRGAESLEQGSGRSFLSPRSPLFCLFIRSVPRRKP
jgi:hypothetical protein